SKAVREGPESVAISGSWPFIAGARLGRVMARGCGPGPARGIPDPQGPILRARSPAGVAALRHFRRTAPQRLLFEACALGPDRSGPPLKTIDQDLGTRRSAGCASRREPGRLKEGQAAVPSPCSAQQGAFMSSIAPDSRPRLILPALGKTYSSLFELAETILRVVAGGALVTHGYAKILSP